MLAEHPGPRVQTSLSVSTSRGVTLIDAPLRRGRPGPDHAPPRGRVRWRLDRLTKAVVAEITQRNHSDTVSTKLFAVPTD